MFKRMLKGVVKALDDAAGVSGQPKAETPPRGPTSRPTRDSAAILKEATAAKKDGRIEDAIDLLREAYDVIDRESGGDRFSFYTPATFIRLPQYLHAAGRSDEAWSEFEALKLRTAKELHPELVPMAHHSIYDKQRLFLQREGKPVQAIQLGIMSHLSWLTGLAVQRRPDELATDGSRERVRAEVEKLLRKAKRLDAVDAVTDVVMAEVPKVPQWDPAALRAGLGEALGLDET